MIFKMKQGRGLATCTGKKGATTTQWLNLYDLIFHFARHADLQFETVSIMRDTIWFNRKTHGLVYRLNFTYPVCYADEKILAALQRQFIVDCFGDKYLTIKPKEVPRKFLDDEFPDNPDSEDGWDMTEDFYDISRATTIVRLENDLLQYATVREDKRMQASETTCHIFSLRTGKPIVYADIFKPNVREKLAKLVINSYLEKGGSDLIWEGEFQLSDNIKMEDNGLSFIYGNPITARTGYQEAMFVPYTQLLPYMKIGSPLYEIAQKIKN